MQKGTLAWGSSRTAVTRSWRQEPFTDRGGGGVRYLKVTGGRASVRRLPLQQNLIIACRPEHFITVHTHARQNYKGGDSKASPISILRRTSNTIPTLPLRSLDQITPYPKHVTYIPWSTFCVTRRYLFVLADIKLSCGTWRVDTLVGYEF